MPHSAARARVPCGGCLYKTIVNKYRMMGQRCTLDLLPLLSLALRRYYQSQAAVKDVPVLSRTCQLEYAVGRVAYDTRHAMFQRTADGQEKNDARCGHVPKTPPPLTLTPPLPNPFVSQIPPPHNPLSSPYV